MTGYNIFHLGEKKLLDGHVVIVLNRPLDLNLDKNLLGLRCGAFEEQAILRFEVSVEKIATEKNNLQRPIWGRCFDHNFLRFS
jgi:hypothetical protein